MQNQKCSTIWLGWTLLNTIFFSWQSDLPNSYNRNLIENVIKSTLKKINRENNLSLVLDIDRNTDGLLGSPDIAVKNSYKM